jgi:hypothetical protein
MFVSFKLAEPFVTFQGKSSRKKSSIHVCQESTDTKGMVDMSQHGITRFAVIWRKQMSKFVTYVQSLTNAISAMSRFSKTCARQV